MKFTLKDICNVDDAFSYATGSNPHNMRGFILHDHGFVITVVWASNLQDALDEAVDKNKLDHFKITEEESTGYPGIDTGECDGVAYLGNASEPFDIENVDCVEISNGRFIDQLMAVEFEV